MPDQNTTYKEKLEALRSEMVALGLDGFIVPRADAFQGEFVAKGEERLQWLSGFTGSAGVVVVLNTRAIVLTDGRYTLQVKEQVDEALFETGDSTKTKVSEWLCEYVEKGAVIGFDPWLHTHQQVEALEKGLKEKGVVLKPVSENLIDKIWEDQPAPPLGQVEIFPDSVAGLSSVEKRKTIAAEIEKAGADACVLTLPDSICWLLNVRGSDVDYAPVVLSYAIIHADDGRVDWFVEAEKISDEVKAHLGDGVKIHAPGELEKVLKGLAGQKVALDYQRAPIWFQEALEEKSELVDLKDPCVSPKSGKTKEEQKSVIDAHVKDGVAMVRFLAWLDEEAPKGDLTELDIVAKLEDLRSSDKDYKGPSFATISGFGPNGAIVHYRVSEETNAKIIPPGLLLVDSGGQYHWGTTDITRTIAIGEPSEEMRVHFTRVLKGHIALAMAHFPDGTVGAQIDTLARQPLWNAGLDFAHGTGHGVGCYLQVHEEAASISPRGKEPFKPGMLISNEPGYYEEGAYGIRIESLVLVEEAGRCDNTDVQMLQFKTVTLAPIDRHLIVSDMLSTEERNWLNDYHAEVQDVLSLQLDEATAAWLKEQTEPL